MAIPNVFAVRRHARRVLKDRFPQIVDALEPGGSGDMYAGLNVEEAEALREVSRMGFPPPSWFGYKTIGVHAFSVLYPAVVMADPSYFDDFWTVPGYLGANPPASLLKARLQHFQLADVLPDVGFLGGDMVVKTGAAAGKTIPISRVAGDTVILGFADPGTLAELRPGDRWRRPGYSPEDADEGGAWLKNYCLGVVAAVGGTMPFP